ncbi:hypothetical protein LZ32DRAFT_351689 [Colletotrichum eremochloae]|nr:hypothetical protein LZ32DRAFT_351689 [Colletotrichum eremochloae]
MTTILRRMTKIHDCALNDMDQEQRCSGARCHDTNTLGFLFASHRLSNFRFWRQRLATRTGSNNGSALIAEVGLRKNHLVAETWPYPEYGRRGRHRFVDRILAAAASPAEGGRPTWKWRKDGIISQQTKRSWASRRRYLAAQDTMQRPLAEAHGSALMTTPLPLDLRGNDEPTPSHKREGRHAARSPA